MDSEAIIESLRRSGVCESTLCLINGMLFEKLQAEVYKYLMVYCNEDLSLCEAGVDIEELARSVTIMMVSMKDSIPKPLEGQDNMFS